MTGPDLSNCQVHVNHALGSKPDTNALIQLIIIAIKVVISANFKTILTFYSNSVKYFGKLDHLIANK
jgi:hypothetical protein